MTFTVPITVCRTRWCVSVTLMLKMVMPTVCGVFIQSIVKYTLTVAPGEFIIETYRRKLNLQSAPLSMDLSLGY